MLQALLPVVTTVQKQHQQQQNVADGVVLVFLN